MTCLYAKIVLESQLLVTTELILFSFHSPTAFAGKTAPFRISESERYFPLCTDGRSMLHDLKIPLSGATSRQHATRIRFIAPQYKYRALQKGQVDRISRLMNSYRTCRPVSRKIGTNPAFEREGFAKISYGLKASKC